MSKLEKMQRFLPSFYKPSTNVNVRGLLYAWSSEDDLIVNAIQDAKEQLFVKYAQLNFLDALGSNVGVFRPTAIGLADIQFRELIPALSFYPKQVRLTIQKVLDVFFGANNPIVRIAELKPNEIVIQIPSSVPALRRSLKGSLHFHNYSGAITSIDNIAKTITIDLAGTQKNLVLDELKDAVLGQELLTYKILSNTVGNSGVILQFEVTEDLSLLNLSKKFMIANVPNYQGSFFPDLTRSFTLKKERGVINQNIVAGNLYPTLVMQDASGIPDAPGRLVFDFGNGNQEEDIKYFGRPNNTTLLIDSSYAFLKNHSIGSVVNVMVKPYIKPAINGEDLSIYFVGVTAARILAQQIVESVVAAGVVVRWQIVYPRC
jgi:hypothetical protein